MHFIQKLGVFIFIFILFGMENTAMGQTLVWQENFDSTALNTNLWTYDNGDGCERNLCGWGNAELQHYTNRPENIRVENGNLIIEARRENYGTRSFTSGRIKTEGRVHIKYGTIEARIKIPNLANGLWPAFWTLGTIGPSWPAIGEMDIMEMGSQSARLAGLINRQVSSATHWSNNGVKDIRGSSTNASVNLNDDYHLYKLVWSQQSIKMFLDGVLILEQDITNNLNGTEEFHQPHFLLLNVAIGGAYTGLLNNNDITATMPAKMYVDYVKVYQNPGDEISFNRFNTTSGNFGVLTETTPKTDSITLGTNATLNYWNNLTAISNAVPYEGNQLIAVRANPGNWFGMGIDHKYINLSDHVGGTMKFHCKTTHQGLFKIGLRSADGESWIPFPANSSTYGLIRDGNWHEVSIPLSAFNNPSTSNYIDYVAVKYAFMLVGDAPTTTADFYFDNIYFNKNTAVTPTLGAFSVPSKVLGQPAFTLTPPSSNSTGSFTYSSSNTAVATISGNIVTLTGAGTSTITATQSSSGIYGPASVSANLVVTSPTLNTAAPTPPARNAADVISLYSNAYTNISGIDWFPNWGQSTIATDVLIQSNQTRKYENLNYQGVQFSGAVNAATMANLHIDIWTPNCNTFNVYLINTSPTLKEQKVALTPTFSGWNSYDIPLSSYDLITLSSIQQMKFDCTPFGTSLVYFDNLYFWKTSNAPVITGFSFPAKFLGDAPFAITTPTSNSTGSFSYSSSNNSVATVSGSTITIVGVGTATITATQAASGIYSAGSATADLIVSYPVPTIAAPLPPGRRNEDYVSLFGSNIYNDLQGIDFNPYWGKQPLFLM
jgi:beta-glucanase (GH16 family)